MDLTRRHAASVRGPSDADTIVFAHGFGCDQAMWVPVADQFPDYRTVLFDLVGFGNSDLAAYDRDKYRTLDGHADDVVELCGALGLTNATFVGHSVSSMIGVLAANRAPGLFGRMVLVGPSPRYVDDGDYRGGFTRSDIEEMLDALDTDFFAWSVAMAPVIAGNPDRPEHGERLARSFCASDPEAARQLARVTFLADNRADLPLVTVPTLVMQCADDPIAPTEVGTFVSEQIPRARFVQLEATGHCPNLTAPDETAQVIRSFLE